MIPRRIPFLARAALVLLPAALAACGLFKGNEAVQTTLNQRVVGLSAGDFFQQYGTWRTRTELSDGSTEYNWISAIGPTENSGYYGLDDRTCTLRLVAAKNGRITSVDVVLDNLGRMSTSRCGEMFKPK